MCESFPEGNRGNAEPRAGGGVEEGRGGGRKESKRRKRERGVSGKRGQMDQIPPEMLSRPEDGRVCFKVTCKVPHTLGLRQVKNCACLCPQVSKGQRGQ